MFCRSLFVLLFFFFWPLCCLFFFDIRILITPLVSSNSSYTILTRVTQPVPLVEKELHTLHEHMSSPTVFSGIPAQFFFFSVWFCRSLSYCHFYFSHCIVCSSSYYGFSLPVWYLQIFLNYLVIKYYTSK